MRDRIGGGTGIAALASLLAFAAVGRADAQAFVQVGAQTARIDGARAEWVVGGGYNFDVGFSPVAIGVLAQATTGYTETDGGPRTFPARAFLTARFKAVPGPGFSVFAGGGYGLIRPFGGEEDAGGDGRGFSQAALGFAGIATGRLSFELQVQRQFLDDPDDIADVLRTVASEVRWVSVVGVSF